MSQQAEQLKTQVSNLIDALTDTESDGPYSATLNDLLDQAILTMQKIQDDMSNDAEADIIAGLNTHNQDLADLNTAMDTYSKTLDATAAKIKHIADTVGLVTGIVVGIVSSGIL
jgi:ABC-type transporter Mla subunit MlaD